MLLRQTLQERLQKFWRVQRSRETFEVWVLTHGIHIKRDSQKWSFAALHDSFSGGKASFELLATLTHHLSGGKASFELLTTLTHRL